MIANTPFLGRAVVAQIPRRCEAVRVHPDGFAIALTDEELSLWDFEGEKLDACTFDGESLERARDGTIVVVGDEPRAVRIVDRKIRLEAAPEIPRDLLLLDGTRVHWEWGELTIGERVLSFEKPIRGVQPIASGLLVLTLDRIAIVEDGQIRTLAMAHTQYGHLLAHAGAFLAIALEGGLLQRWDASGTKTGEQSVGGSIMNRYDALGDHFVACVDPRNGSRPWDLVLCTAAKGPRAIERTFVKVDRGFRKTTIDAGGEIRFFGAHALVGERTVWDLATMHSVVTVPKKIGDLAVVRDGIVATMDDGTFFVERDGTLVEIELPREKSRVDYHPAMESMSQEEIDQHTPSAIVTRLVPVGEARVGIVTSAGMTHFADVKAKSILFSRLMDVVDVFGTIAICATRFRGLDVNEIDGYRTLAHLDRASRGYGDGLRAFVGESLVTCTTVSSPSTWDGRDTRTSEIRIWSTTTWTCERVIEVRALVTSLVSVSSDSWATARKDDPVPYLLDRALDIADEGSVLELARHPEGFVARKPKSISLYGRDGALLAHHTIDTPYTMRVREDGTIVLPIGDAFVLLS